jgi:hypothetical protein
MTLVNWKTPLAANEVPGSRGGSVTGVQGDETVVWLMKTDSAFETMATLIAYGVLPAYLAPHPQAPYATLRELSHKPAAKTNVDVGAYHVTAKYSSAPLSQDDRDKAIQDPTARPAKITVKPKQVMESYNKDVDGYFICNAAGDEADPPLERPVTRWVFAVVKNVPSVPLWFLDYEESTNDADFDIKGVTVLKGCGKLSGINISDDMVENGVNFLQVSFEIEVKAPPTGINVIDGREPSEETAYTPEGWTTLLLNQGLRERDPDDPIAVTNMTDSNGDQLTAPTLLDSDGSKLANPNAASAVYLAWRTLPSKDFSVIPVT